MFFVFSFIVYFTFASERPHVLLIVADDYGWNDVGYHQNTKSSANPRGEETTNVFLKTPNLDRLASEGRKLENYYVQPLCSPTRATIMTGRYASHTGIGPNVIEGGHPYALPKDEVIMPQMFSSADYSTHIVGKWHLGLCDERYTPTFRGFDSFTGYLLGAEDYFYHNRSESGFSGLDLRNSSSLSASNEMPKATRESKGVYSTDVFVQAVERIIHGRDSTKRTFVYMPFQSVHGPLQAPQKYIDLYPDTMDKSRRKYAGMVSALDDAVGRIEDIYKQAGIWNRTILVFTTDNGGPLDSANNFPLRGHKATAWEGGIRGVAFVRGTNDPSLDFSVPPGTTSMELMHSTDWVPTLSAVAGFEMNLETVKSLDGVNQWGAIARSENSTRTSIIHNCPGANDTDDGGAIRVGQFKLLIESEAMQVVPKMQQFPPPGFDPLNVSSLLCPAPKPVQGMWLFNVIEDPLECTNLVKTYPQKLYELQVALAEYKKSAVPDLATLHGEVDPQCDPAKQDDGAWGPWAQKSDKCVYI